jgi:cyanate permease
MGIAMIAATARTLAAAAAPLIERIVNQSGVRLVTEKN